MRRHVWKLLSAQRDLLPSKAIEGVQASMDEVTKTIAAGTSRKDLLPQMENMEKAANKWLNPYPNPVVRENIEVLLVALVVAMGIRTFFAQPFKIPTGSMQPTLYGVMPQPVPNPGAGNQPDLQIPGRLARLYDYWVFGVSYFHITAPEDGLLVAVKPPVKLLLFNLKQEYRFNDNWYTVWFPADELFQRAGYAVRRFTGHVGRVNPLTGQLEEGSPRFKRGKDIVRLKVLAGDHLFVDRLTYNFRKPRRGDIIVFETQALDPARAAHFGIAPDQFYIKRLVALGNEKVRIGDDSHLLINGVRLDASSPGFENVYSSGPTAGDEQYFGHVPLGMFEDGHYEHQVPPGRFMVMGDNTRNSLDSRYFGDFSQEYVIGKSWFVYWPISKRFGLGYR